MQDKTLTRRIAAKYRALAQLMDERMRRQWAATEAQALGWGGVQTVSGAIGMSPNTIRKGLGELTARAKHPDKPVSPRLRRAGAGRKRATESDPRLLQTLKRLVEPMTRGDPMSPRRGTCKSTTQLAQALTHQGHPVSPRTVGRLLRADGYSLQSNRKTQEGTAHPDRNGP